MVVVIMGVSGVGKTTVGRALAKRLEWTFWEGDDFHPKANVDRMASGIPLSDADRLPWLERIRDRLGEACASNASVVLSCSALKDTYRCLLSDVPCDVRFVLLRASFDTIRERMVHRKGHFMPPELLQSQFQALEEPADALVVDAVLPTDEITTRIIDSLSES